MIPEHARLPVLLLAQLLDATAPLHHSPQTRRSGGNLNDEHLKRLVHRKPRTTLLDDRDRFEHALVAAIVVGLLCLGVLVWLVMSQ